MKQITLLIAVLISSFCYAQDDLNYLKDVSELQNDVSKKYMSYVSSVSHGKRARKVEKNRSELLQTIQSSKAKAGNMRPFKGDFAMKEALKNYLGILYNVLNEDYGKLVNMEEVAEQSYDAMEALFLAQDLAGKKSEQAFKKYGDAYEAFAKKNNITIIEAKSELSTKLAKVAEVNNYYHKMYLLFFKPYKQEFYMIDAQSKKDISAIEQNKNTLEKNAKQAIGILDTTKAYLNDKSLIIAAKDIMNFYSDEASKSKVVTEYFLKADNFEKLNKAFNAKSAKSRTQADVDNYNNQVKEVNVAMNAYNSLSIDMNKKRELSLDKWNKAVSKFLDYHTPKY